MGRRFVDCGLPLGPGRRASDEELKEDEVTKWYHRGSEGRGGRGVIVATVFFHPKSAGAPTSFGGIKAYYVKEVESLEP